MSIELLLPECLNVFKYTGWSFVLCLCSGFAMWNQTYKLISHSSAILYLSQTPLHNAVQYSQGRIHDVRQVMQNNVLVSHIHVTMIIINQLPYLLRIQVEKHLITNQFWSVMLYTVYIITKWGTVLWYHYSSQSQHGASHRALISEKLSSWLPTIVCNHNYGNQAYRVKNDVGGGGGTPM